MKTCSLCNQIRPASSFYRDGSWCQDCRVAKRAEWKKLNPGLDKAYKMLTHNGKEVDPTAYGKTHCEHIASYAKRAIERFEHKTGLEAPPELTAIHQLASRLTDTQQSQLADRKWAPPRQCVHCGKEFRPRMQGQHRAKYCSNACHMKVKAITHPHLWAPTPEQLRARAAREAEAYVRRIGEAHRKHQHEQREQNYLDAATKAVEMRTHGHKWQDIADTLGYSGTGAAFNAIRLRLGIDPRTLTRSPSSPPATT